MANITQDSGLYETAGQARAAGDVAELGELVAGLAAETAVLAEAIGRIVGNVDEVDTVVGIMLAAGDLMSAWTSS
jgi:hypothetical protein